MNTQIAYVIHKLVRRGMTPEAAAAKCEPAPMAREYALASYYHYRHFWQKKGA
jgi:hypothetical protein